MNSGTVTSNSCISMSLHNDAWRLIPLGGWPQSPKRQPPKPILRCGVWEAWPQYKLAAYTAASLSNCPVITHFCSLPSMPNLCALCLQTLRFKTLWSSKPNLCALCLQNRNCPSNFEVQNSLKFKAQEPILMGQTSSSDCSSSSCTIAFYTTIQTASIACVII